MSHLLAIDASMPEVEAVAAVRDWVDEHVPSAWRDAASRGGAAAIRAVRSRAEYEEWYPVFGASGLVAPTWPTDCGGLDVSAGVARAIDDELRPYNLGRLNPLGLNLCAPALFAHGTDEQRRRFLPPIVRNEEKWCQLFSEPGAGSDLASLATRAVLDGDEWVVDGQKVWTTWAHQSDWAVLLARTDPSVAKRKGITYFLLDLHQPGVDVRPLRHITGAIDFNEVFLDGARIPDSQRVSEVGEGWRVANATLSSERQMVSGAGSGGVDRIGGLGVDHTLDLAVKNGRSSDPITRQRLAALFSEERIRAWTNQRVRAGLATGKPPGAASSVGKIHSGEMNQRLQLLAVDLLGTDALAWDSDAAGEAGSARSPEETPPAASTNGVGDYESSLPHEVRGMLRSRANTIEGGTSEVNRNIVGERVLGLPREPDQWQETPWAEVPRS